MLGQDWPQGSSSQPLAKDGLPLVVALLSEINQIYHKMSVQQAPHGAFARSFAFGDPSAEG